MVLSQKMEVLPLQVREDLFIQVKEFRYLEVSFMTEGREQINRLV